MVSAYVQRGLSLKMLPSPHVSGFVAPPAAPWACRGAARPIPLEFAAKRASCAPAFVLSCTAGSDAGGEAEELGIYGYSREVIRREEAEAPLRGVRLGLFAGFATIAAALAAASAASLAGVAAFEEIGPALPNPALDAAVLGAAFWLWREDVKAKRVRLAAIDAAYRKKLQSLNRAERRRAKIEGGGKKSLPPPLTKPAVAAAATATATDAGASAAAQQRGAAAKMDAGSDGGGAAGAGENMPLPFLEKWKRTLADVNQQSYFQALAFNEALEVRGMLPPLKKTAGDDAGAGGDEEAEAAEGEADGKEGASEEIVSVASTEVPGATKEGADAAEAAARGKKKGQKAHTGRYRKKR